MTTLTPPMLNNADPRRGRVDTSDPRLRKSALPIHLQKIRLPDGRQLGDLSPADVARVCSMAGIPGSGAEQGKIRNAELLASTLEAVGRQAAEIAIATWLQARIR